MKNHASLMTCGSAGVALLGLLGAGRALAQAVAAPAAGGAASDQPASMGAQLQEVVVTAMKTGAQNLQRTPASLTVISGQQLTAAGIDNIGKLAQTVPNVSFNRNTGFAEIYIRGIGSNNIGPGSDPDVTTQVDGVYIARASEQLTDFLDVDQVQVLRGPQGTLYGRNAVGGTILISSRQPSDIFTGETVLSGGNFGYAELQGYLSGPLASNLQGSVAYDWGYHSPYFKNVSPGGHDVGNDQHRGIHVQMRWEPTADVDATTRADFSYQNQDMISFSHDLLPTFSALTNSIIGNLGEVNLNTPQNLYSQDGGVSEEVNWRFAPGFNLKSITAYRQSLMHFTNDNDNTQYNVVVFNSAEQDKSASQEFDLQYKGNGLTGVAGLYLFHDNDTSPNHVVLYLPPPPAPLSITETTAAITHVDTTSGAVFAQGTYSITSTFSAVLGARYTYENKGFDQNPYSENVLEVRGRAVPLPATGTPFTLSKNFSKLTPKFGLNWQVTPDDLLYISATRGYKSGGFNYVAPSPVGAEFAPETIWSFEGGIKSEWLDHRLRLDADGFYYHYTDLQVQQLLAFGLATIGNAATADGRGAEVELIAKPAPSLELTVNFSALDAKYVSYPNASVPQGAVGLVPGEFCIPSKSGGSPSCSANAAGHYLNNAPATSAFAAIDDTHSVFGYLLTVHADYNWHSRTYFDPSNILVLSQGKYGLLNANVSCATPHGAWRLELFGNNLTDKIYAVSAVAPGFVPSALPGDPRTYGARLSYRW